MASPIFEGKLTPVQRLIRLLKLDKKEIGQLYFYAIFQNLVALTLPLGIQAIINLIQGGVLPTTWWVLVVIVVAGIIAAGALHIMQLHITENLKQRIFTRAAFEFAYRIPKIRFDLLHRRHVPELINRFFDTISIQKGVAKILLDFSAALLQVIFGLILLSFYHPFFILFGFVLISIVALIINIWGPRGLNTSLKESSHKYDVAYWLEEVARSLRVFKVSGNQKLHLERSDEHVKGYLEARNDHFKILVSQYSSLIVFKAIVAAGLLLIGSILVVEQELNLGQFVAAEIIILLVINSVEKIILTLEDIYDVLTALEKVGSVTDFPLEHKGGNTPVYSTENGFHVEASQLSFKYPDGDKNVFGPLNFEILPKSKWYICGENGSGKSTLIHTLASFYENYGGSILVNGLSLHAWNLDDFRNQIGTCFTNEELFAGSIRENITFGNPLITDEEIFEFSKIFFWEESIKELPMGLDTVIDPDGKHLPGSLVKKIILTRAFVNHPQLVLIEDSLRQINSKERFEIWKWISAEDNPYTVIAILNDDEITALFNNKINL